jgi:hypothetical protein
MDLVQRVRAVILTPKEEWKKIKGESTTPADLMASYAVILAAIPAVSQFIGNVLVGRRLPFVGWYRWGIGRALGYAVLAYVFSLATVYLFALIVDALAPSFASQRNMTNALKLSVYSMTPGWVAGVFNIFPFLWVLPVLASVYGLYILYLGFDTPLMDTPKDKVAGYMVVSIVVAILLYVIFGLILGWIFAVRYHGF